MFRALAKLLFSSFNKADPNFLYFEDNKNSAQEIQEEQSEFQKATITQTTETIEEKNLRIFYDFLFGQSPPTQQHDELSSYVSLKIKKLLKSPQKILEALPVLPVSLTKVLEQLNDKEFDAEVLVNLIQQEPTIAAKVIELANSAYYNRSHKEITDIKSAFMLLGTNGLMEGVINGFVSKLKPHSQIYFKQYGTKIWKHSQTSGIIAKGLIAKSQYNNDSAQGYLIGLICNLGDMIIYQLLIDAFSFVHPDCQPNSYAFKELMQKNSKKLTYHIAKHWNFPSSILDALAVQAKLTKSSMLGPVFTKRPIACYVYEANIISQLALRLEYKDIDEDELNEAKNFLLYSEEAKSHIENLIIMN